MRHCICGYSDTVIGRLKTTLNWALSNFNPAHLSCCLSCIFFNMLIIVLLQGSLLLLFFFLFYFSILLPLKKLTLLLNISFFVN